MHTGIVLYGTDKVAASTSLELGMLFFKKTGLDISLATHEKHTINKYGEDDYDEFDISLAELSEKTRAVNNFTFRLFNFRKNADPYEPYIMRYVHATYKITGLLNRGYSAITFEYPGAINSDLISLVKSFTKSATFDYGIVYSFNQSSDIYFYSVGINFLSLFSPCEDSRLFNMDLLPRFSSSTKKLHKAEKLRMVYSHNFLNHQHLAIPVNNITLHECILNNNFGTLEELSNGMWLWTVEEHRLEELNHYFGEAGILISWRLPPPPPKIRKLP